MNTTEIVKPTNSPRIARSMISPQADFLLVGGASVLVLILALIGRRIFGADYKSAVVAAGVFAYFASFAVNYPHFAFSYQIFYSDFLTRLRDPRISKIFKWRTVFSGLIAPFFIIYYLIAAMIISPESAQLMVSVMFFLVGWHYVKQGYGVLITLSVYRGIFYTAWEKRLLSLNCYCVWIFIWLTGQYVSFDKDYYGITYNNPTFSGKIIEIAGLVSLLTTIAALAVILKVWLKDKRGLSFNGVLGYFCAVYLWMGFANIDPVFFIVVPFFHGLQYFPFVYKYRANKKRSEGAANRKPLIVFALSGILLGGFFMDIGPKIADHLTFSAGYTRSFYLSSFLLFINIHHYFIDHAFWRKENRQVQNNLFLSLS